MQIYLLFLIRRDLVEIRRLISRKKREEKKNLTGKVTNTQI
jgi:hypothetical protein